MSSVVTYSITLSKWIIISLYTDLPAKLAKFIFLVAADAVFVCDSEESFYTDPF